MNFFIVLESHIDRKFSVISYLYVLFSIIFMINVGSNQTFRTFIEKSNFQTEIPNLSLKGVEVLICNL